MHASTEIEVGLDALGHTVVRRMRCEVPLLVRVIDCGGSELTLAMVNGAAGPLGGDRLRFRLQVGEGARVRVGSVAASLAQPGPRGDESVLELDVIVAEGASLDWAPQPMVSVTGSRHRTVVRLAAAATSAVRMQEIISLGRHGEPGGRLSLRQRVTVGNDPVLDHETVFDRGALSGPGAHGPGRTVTSVMTVGADLPPAIAIVTSDCAHATFHVTPTCALTVTTR